jgi:hypothetical protein
VEIPKPIKLQELEEVEDDDEEVEQPISKKEVQMGTPETLTEEKVLNILESFSYRLGRIEHYLRLDY